MMPTSALLALITACALWGTTGVVASFMTDDVSPLAVGAFTMGVGGLLLLAVTWRAVRTVPSTAGSLRWVLLGGIGVFVYPLAFYSGMDLVGVAVGNSIALGSGPLFAGVVEGFLTRKRPSVVWFVALAVAIGGLVLVALDKHSGGSNALLGILLGLLAGLAYALYSVAAARLIAAGVEFRGAMGAVFGAGALPLLVVLVVTGAPLVSDSSNLARGLYLAVGPLVLAYLLFGYALTRVTAASATLVTLLEPAFSVILAVLILGETLSGGGWLGIVLLISAVALASLRFPTRKSPPNGAIASNLVT
jgi:DME family drug/metabolite transporter